MLKMLPLGTYYPGQSLLHRLQARTKLFLLLWLVAWLTIANHLKWHLEPYVLALVLLALGLFFSGLSLRTLWQRMWLLVLLMLLGVWPILTTTDGAHRTLLTIGPFGIPYGPLRLSLLLVGGLGFALLLSTYLPALYALWQKPQFRRLKSLLWFVTLVSFLLLWLASGSVSNQDFLLGPALVTDSGVWTLITFSSFLLLLYAFSLLLTMTTSPMALIEGMTMVLAPLRRFRLPVDSFALMTLLALRFLPTLLETTEQLSKAQTARGADLTSGTLRERFQSLTMLFVPLIHSVFRDASELGTALEARGYQSEGRQTPLYETTFHLSDYSVCLVIVILTIASILI